MREEAEARATQRPKVKKRGREKGREGRFSPKDAESDGSNEGRQSTGLASLSWSAALRLRRARLKSEATFESDS